MTNTGAKIIIKSATVPRTSVTVTLSYRRDADRFEIERTAQTGVCNYLCTQRAQIGEARETANFLWTDAVERRDGRK